MTSELKLLITELGIEKDRAVVNFDGPGFLDYEFDVNPEDFLEQAEEDYEQGGNAVLLNAITNAKRAIRSQIDKVLYCTGFNAKEMKIRKKLDLLRELGVVTPRIIRKVDNARNLLEYEFKSPSVQDVEDAIDLAALFIQATNHSINPIGAEFVLSNSDEYIGGLHGEYLHQVNFSFDSEQKRFRIWGVSNIPDKSEPNGVKRIALGRVVYLSSQDVMYLPVLHIAIIIIRNREHKTTAATEKFFDALERVS